MALDPCADAHLRPPQECCRRDNDVQMTDLEEAVQSFIDPLDPELLALQELAAVLACSDRRYLPQRYRDADRAKIAEEFTRLKLRAGRR